MKYWNRNEILQYSAMYEKVQSASLNSYQKYAKISLRIWWGHELSEGFNIGCQRVCPEKRFEYCETIWIKVWIKRGWLYFNPKKEKPEFDCTSIQKKRNLNFTKTNQRKKKGTRRKITLVTGIRICRDNNQRSIMNAC